MRDVQDERHGLSPDVQHANLAHLSLLGVLENPERVVGLAVVLGELRFHSLGTHPCLLVAPQFQFESCVTRVPVEVGLDPLGVMRRKGVGEAREVAVGSRAGTIVGAHGVRQFLLDGLVLGIQTKADRGSRIIGQRDCFGHVDIAGLRGSQRVGARGEVGYRERPRAVGDNRARAD